MTSVLNENDKIYTMYRQYKELIHNEAEENNNRVYGTDQLAAQLTVAHMLDHVVCLLKKDDLPTVKKVNDTWKQDMEKTKTLGSAMEELEIMRNNASPLQEYPPNFIEHS